MGIRFPGKHKSRSIRKKDYSIASSNQKKHEHILNDIEKMLLMGMNGKTETPVVTVSYAQSLDGSIARRKGEKYQLSGDHSMQLTHGLRAMHDAILIGVGTVLADDPLLTVRLDDGSDPRPIILDSQLRIPASCKLFQKNEHSPIIATTSLADNETLEKIRSLGADVMVLDQTKDNQVDLVSLLTELYRRDIHSVMVEGGTEVITNFFSQHLVDLIVLTIAPQILRGVPGINPVQSEMQTTLPQIIELHAQKLGKDIIVWGQVE